MDQTLIGYEPVVEEISNFRWESLDQQQLSAVALAYWYFSIQFRESLEITAQMYPHDQQIKHLVKEECNTANLSPWPGVAEEGEQLDHDEFMKRTLTLSPLDDVVKTKLAKFGSRYLAAIEKVDNQTRALSIASYECGGLETVFKAMLRARHWNSPLLGAFKHFLQKHIDFDSNPTSGHGALIKHLEPDHKTRWVWVEFRDLLLAAAPSLMP